MYSCLLKIINPTDGRYLTPVEQNQVLAYAKSVPSRLLAARHVEQKEEEIINTVLERMKPRYPNFTGQHDRAWEKGFRDMQLVLRYIVQGMLLDDLDAASEKLLFWFRTIVASVGMTPQFMRDHYHTLRDVCQQRLPAESFALLEPHLNRAAEVLSDFPEPYRPAV
ncbi:MAG: hypothetical protein ACK4RK_05790 [Gemmataceae bacterium]